MYVLHLFDDASPQASSTTLALLAASQGKLQTPQGDEVHQRILLIGGKGLRQAAADLALPDTVQIGAPMQKVMMAWPAARCALRRFRPLSPEQGPLLLSSLRHPDVIHCWGIGAFTLAAVLFPVSPIVLTLSVTPSPRDIKWLRLLVDQTSGLLLPISATIRRELLAGGVAESAVHVLRPGIDLAMVHADDRAALRKELGIESHDRVVALLSDPTTATATPAPGMAVGLADETSKATGRRVRLLVHPDQHDRRRAQRTMEGIACGHRIITDERLAQPWRILPACDAAMAMGPEAGGLSLLWAMAAGIPIVGEARYAISEVVEDRHSALLAKPGAAKWLAMRLSQVFAEPQMAWKLRDTARHEAYSYFSRHRYRNALATVYKQVSERQPVAVPAMEITGGLRFSV